MIEERKNLRKKDRLSFEILIFRNDQPDRDDDRRIVVAITSTCGSVRIVEYRSTRVPSLCPLDLHVLSYIMYMGCRGRDRMIFGFTTTCIISPYHH